MDFADAAGGLLGIKQPRIAIRRAGRHEEGTSSGVDEDHPELMQQGERERAQRTHSNRTVDGQPGHRSILDVYLNAPMLGVGAVHQLRAPQLVVAIGEPRHGDPVRTDHVAEVVDADRLDALTRAIGGEEE